MKINGGWIIVALLWTGVAQSTEPVRSLDWAVEAEVGRLPDGVELVTSGESSFVEIRHAGSGALVLPLAKVEAPEIDALQWAMRGMVRYEDVVAGGVLEMWSVFPDGARYFSRTAAAEGPMAALQGTSDWREFSLAFTCTPGMPPPARLELNLVLQGPGTVWLGPVDVIELMNGGTAAAVADVWWSERQGGLAGGVAGGLIGILGAVVGVMSAMGRGRALVRAILAIFVLIGVVAIVAAVVAFVGGQPQGVWYPLGLIGLITGVVGGTLWRPIDQRFSDVEDRRIRAMDL